MNMRGKRAFTFLELLLVMAIFPFIGMAVFGALRGGLEIWQRSLSVENNEDWVIFQEKFSSDIRNAAAFSAIKPRFEASGMSFTSVGGAGDNGKDVSGIQEVEYAFDYSGGRVTRTVKGVKQIFSGEIGEPSVIMRGVVSFSFAYLYHDAEKGWQEFSTFTGDAMPRFVKLTIVHSNALGKQSSLSRLIPVPCSMVISGGQA